MEGIDDAPPTPLPPVSQEKNIGTKTPTTETWSTVLGRKERRKKNKERSAAKRDVGPSVAVLGQPGNQRVKDAQAGNKTQKKVTRKPPRTAAVTLTCPPDQYAATMRKAREIIDLDEIEIKSLKPKRAVTGALVLEVPGPGREEKAVTLRNRMEEALAQMERVRVARPVK